MKKIIGNIEGRVIEYYDNSNVLNNGVIVKQNNEKSVIALGGSEYHWKEAFDGCSYGWTYLTKEKISIDDINKLESEEESKDLLKMLKDVSFKKDSWEERIPLAKKVQKEISEIKTQNGSIEITNEEKYENVIVTWEEMKKEEKIDPSKECHSKIELDCLIKKLLIDNKTIKTSIRIYFYTSKSRIKYILE